MKRRKIVITVLLCVAVIIAFSIRSHNREPQYEGRRLSYWLALYEQQWFLNYPEETEKQQKAEQAIRAIGTNSLPYLVEWIRYDTPAWRRQLGDMLPRGIRQSATINSFIEGAAAERSENALNGFRILGTNAVGVVPELAMMLKSNTSVGIVTRTAYALGAIGPAALSTLTNALADPKKKVRCLLVHALLPNSRISGTNAVLPALMASLTDADVSVRSMATNVLEKIAPEALTPATPSP